MALYLNRIRDHCVTKWYMVVPGIFSGWLNLQDWNLQDWNLTDKIAGLEIVGLKFEGVEFDGLKFDGLKFKGIQTKLDIFLKAFNDSQSYLTTQLNILKQKRLKK